MDMIPARRWYEAAIVRRSRRQYDSRPVPPEVYSAMEKACAGFRPFATVRAVLSHDSPDLVFRGAVGPYGKVKGAAAFIAFLGEEDDPFVNEKIGYTGEGIILEATALGLATCWVAGFFREDTAGEFSGKKAGERVFAVTPLGYSPSEFTFEERMMTGFGRAHRRRPLSALVSGLGEKDRPEWLTAALECARSAPSAINRQPWRFHVEASSVTVSVDSPGLDFGISKRIDCGIAMLHLETALLARGIKGKWKLLGPPRVGIFTFE